MEVGVSEKRARDSLYDDDERSDVDSAQDVTEGREIELPDVADNSKARIDYINKEKVEVIKFLGPKNRKGQRVDRDDESVRTRYDRLDRFLLWLDIELQMTLEVKEATHIEPALKLLTDNPRYEWAQSYVDQANALLEKWENENWGAALVQDDDEGEEEDEDLEELVELASGSASAPQPKRRKTTSSSVVEADNDDDAPKVVKLRIAPARHPIWGEDGIMYGAALRPGSKKVVQNPYVQTGNAKVYGHNGFKVGAWYPRQLLAWKFGLHGSHQAGISGDTTKGAYSIVVSGKYENLDEDRGDVLYYSGSGSHDNNDPRDPPKQQSGTKALHASIASKNSVRVLRSDGGRGKFKPIRGLRYDGLYRVVSVRYPINDKGGKYEQFKLVRLEDQRPIDISVPDARQVRDYDRIHRYF